MSTTDDEKLIYFPIPNTGTPCYSCNDMIFMVRTPFGADAWTCPLCNALIDIDDDTCIGDFQDVLFTYCSNCKILFDIGCVHSENGCTSNIYYGSLIKNFYYNLKKYDGMPLFESFHDCKIYMEQMKVEWMCMCNTSVDNSSSNKKRICPGAYYKDSKYYNNCII
jgi:hypothetical protein